MVADLIPLTYWPPREWTSYGYSGCGCRCKHERIYICDLCEHAHNRSDNRGGCVYPLATRDYACGRDPLEDSVQRGIPLCGKHIKELDAFFAERWKERTMHRLSTNGNATATRILTWLDDFDPTEELTDQTMVRDVEPPSRYARAITRWRTPMVHLVATAREIVGTDPYQTYNAAQPGTIYATWECGTTSEVVFYDDVPEGFEVCQRCAEAVAFDAHRERERRTPDRKAYNERTAALLAEAEA